MTKKLSECANCEVKEIEREINTNIAKKEKCIVSREEEKNSVIKQ